MLPVPPSPSVSVHAVSVMPAAAKMAMTLSRKTRSLTALMPRVRLRIKRFQLGSGIRVPRFQPSIAAARRRPALLAALRWTNTAGMCNFSDIRAGQCKGAINFDSAQYLSYA